MRFASKTLALLACFISIHVAGGTPQHSFYHSASGLLTPINANCGACQPGYVRQAAPAPFCGRCSPIQQTCANGYFMGSRGCQTCPCPDTSGQRRFGTTCKVDFDGQVTCECPNGFSGRDCSECAPGAVQSNAYPYDCYMLNSTNSFDAPCVSGNLCPGINIPQLVQPKISHVQVLCPISQGNCQQQQNPGCCPINGGGTRCTTSSQECCTTPCTSQTCLPPPPVCLPPWVPPKPSCQGPIVCPPPPPCIPRPPPPVCNTQCCPCPCPLPPTRPPPPPPTLPPVTPPTTPRPKCENGTNCTICPNPCKECPSPCKECPEMKCPPCILNCTSTGLIVGNATTPCICDPRGTLRQAGLECICKVNVQGARCDQCKKGYFGLSITRPEGCLACFCSGLSDSCLGSSFYRSAITTNSSLDCSIQLTTEDHSVVYSAGSTGFSWDGKIASYNGRVNQQHYWSLPSCLKGDRVTSYGGYLSFSRRCSGGSGALGGDHEVIFVGGSGAAVFWTTFDTPLACDGMWKHVDVLLAESAYWSSWKRAKDEEYRRATRGDIMEVLADLQLILIRASFAPSSQMVSIQNVTLSSVTKSRTREGLSWHVESCRCPTGYRGLSCQSCAPGYYRDTTDVSRSVFGACKPCPCGKTSNGCHLSMGKVVCVCRDGFSGPLCQDKEVITITCDPFSIREVVGATVDFTCSFTTNSKRRLFMRLGREGSAYAGDMEDTTSLTKSITITEDLSRVSCEVLDQNRRQWAVVYCAIEIFRVDSFKPPPLPHMITVFATETLICVDEHQPVNMTCEVHSFGLTKPYLEWRREGTDEVKVGSWGITRAEVSDSGSYVCTASDGHAVASAHVVLMVRRNGTSIQSQYPMETMRPVDKSNYERHISGYPNYPFQADSTKQMPEEKIDPAPKGFPRVFVNPKQIVAIPGDDIVLHCNASGTDIKYYWKYEDKDYIPHARVSHGALLIKNITAKAAGNYYCIVWNPVGQAIGISTVTLADRNEGNTPSVEIVQDRQDAKIGETVSFKCSSNTTGVTYKWSKIGASMPNSSATRDDGLLTLYAVSEASKGTYLCTAISPSGEEKSARAVLKLLLVAVFEPHNPPRITIRPKSPLKVRMGSKVRLECESLLANVTWLKPLDGAEKTLTNYAMHKATYEIERVSASDVGKYICTAVNEGGKRSESLSLVIQDGLPCMELEFRCKSGDQCIAREKRCDNKRDCRDNSDEVHCKGIRNRRSEAKILFEKDV